MRRRSARWRGSSSVAAGTIPEEKWEAGVANIAGWTRYLAARFLEDSSLYNAAKHGLALQAGVVSIAIGETGRSPAIGHEGPAISYLEKDDEKDFDQVTRWLPTDGTCYLVAVAADLIRNLWAVARLRYLDQPIPPRTAMLFDEPPVADAIKETQSAAVAWRMRRHKVAVQRRNSRGRKSA